MAYVSDNIVCNLDADDGMDAGQCQRKQEIDGDLFEQSRVDELFISSNLLQDVISCTVVGSL